MMIRWVYLFFIEIQIFMSRSFQKQKKTKLLEPMGHLKIKARLISL